MTQVKPDMIGLRGSDNRCIQVYTQWWASANICSKVNRRWLDIQMVWTIMDNAQMRLGLVAGGDIILGVDRGSGEIVQIGLRQVSMLHK